MLQGGIILSTPFDLVLKHRASFVRIHLNNRVRVSGMLRFYTTHNQGEPPSKDAAVKVSNLRRGSVKWVGTVYR